MATEIEWRDIPINDGYQANSLGEVWSKDRKIIKHNGGTSYVAVLKGRKLKTWLAGSYLQCSLGAGQKISVHRAVCLAFHGMPEKGKEVAHKDGNSKNNCPDNLMWATHKENEQHKIQHGTFQINRAHFAKPGEKKRGPKRTVHPQSEKIKAMLAQGYKKVQIARAIGMSTSGLHGVIENRLG